jgi:hypothetical protein
MPVQELHNRYQKVSSDVVDKQNSQAADGRTAISVFVSTVIAPKKYIKETCLVNLKVHKDD